MGPSLDSSPVLKPVIGLAGIGTAVNSVVGIEMIHAAVLPETSSALSSISI